MKTVLVCGSSRWPDKEAVRREIQRLTDTYGHLIIVHGDGAGVDEMAWQIAKELGHIPWPFDSNPKHGKNAGPKLNELMLEKAKPDMVIAFTRDLSRSRGTADMVRKARAAEVPVEVIGE